MTMPDYKQRTIKLIPERYDDESWGCMYRVIDISSTGWRFPLTANWLGNVGVKITDILSIERAGDRLKTHAPWLVPV